MFNRSLVRNSTTERMSPGWNKLKITDLLKNTERPGWKLFSLGIKEMRFYGEETDVFSAHLPFCDGMMLLKTGEKRSMSCSVWRRVGVSWESASVSSNRSVRLMLGVRFSRLTRFGADLGFFLCCPGETSFLNFLAFPASLSKEKHKVDYVFSAEMSFSSAPCEAKM